MTSLADQLITFARQGSIVVMAGAGVSAGKPTALPSWDRLHADIVEVLRERLEAAVEKPGWLKDHVPVISVMRQSGGFPPDYQAQIIEEMCGNRYFEGLRAFDIGVRNASHDGIAALAAAGSVEAVVTTNFDRLIEQALKGRGVLYMPAFDRESYGEVLQLLKSEKKGQLPIIKIHGCASKPGSMVDTLKQRKLGRSKDLQECLKLLQPDYWLYLGFSAADLEIDKDYIGLVAGAKHSAGAIYVRRPGHRRNLGKGATILMDAYGDRGRVVEAEVVTFLGDICRKLGKPGPDPIPENEKAGYNQFRMRLKDWAENLSPAAAGLCLAAIFEAIGEAETAFRLLDYLVRKDLFHERDTPDFRLLQLHYGRLGSAWGRAVGVTDKEGVASNISFQTNNNLMKLVNTDLNFKASSYMACLWLWMDFGQDATDLADWLLTAFKKGRGKGGRPLSDEEAVDAWISAAQVCILNTSKQTIGRIYDTADFALQRAKRSGDVVRTARVAALKCLALAETNMNLPAYLEQYGPEFDEAARVRDGFTLGMCSLAHGRWLVGECGLKLAEKLSDQVMIARKALALLDNAVGYFKVQNIDPWVLYAYMQKMKAYADLHRFDEARACLEATCNCLDRFPIFKSAFCEAEGQVRRMRGDPEAEACFRAAIKAAESSGLLFRRAYLKKKYLIQAG